MQSTSQCQGVSTTIALLQLFILIWTTIKSTTTNTNTITTTTNSSSTASNGLTAMKGRGPVEGVVIHKMGQLSQKRRCHLPKVEAALKREKRRGWQQWQHSERGVGSKCRNWRRVGASLSKCFDVFTAAQVGGWCATVCQ